MFILVKAEIISMNILVTRIVPGEGIDILKRHASVKINSRNQAMSREELLQEIKGVHAVLSMLNDRIDREAMDAAGSNLKVISNYAVGYDNVELEEATKRGIIVANTPFVLNEAVADMAFALLLALGRRIVEADNYVRRGEWKHWEPDCLLSRNVYGKTMGIVGLGGIGTKIAERALGFKMNILYYQRHRSREEARLGAKYVDLKTLLKNSDFVVLAVPLTKETEKMIGRKELELMKASAYLINIARGRIIDEKALIEALQNKTIAGATLDVFEKEPVDLGSPLLSMPNVVLAPHIAGSTLETRSEMSVIAAQNILNALHGKPTNVVNPEVLKLKL